MGKARGMSSTRLRQVCQECGGGAHHWVNQYCLSCWRKLQEQKTGTTNSHADARRPRKNSHG